MLNEQFSSLISSTGMATQKELKKIDVTHKNDPFAEFYLHDLENFDENRFMHLMAEANGLTILKINEDEISSEQLSVLQKKVVTKYRLIPVNEVSNKIILTSFDPNAKENLKECMEILGKPCEIVLTNISTWEKLYSRVKVSVKELVDSIEEIDETEVQEDEKQVLDNITSDVVSLVNHILADAFYRGASDIHVEPYEKKFRIRFRIDGSLVEISSPPKALSLAMISRFKIMAKLDISEKRLPQDGRMKIGIAGRTIDYRVSSIPTLFGEKIVLRLLDSSSLELDMTKLGFTEKQLEIFKSGIKKPYGMALVTGPTGSGKTTTLYSALMELNTINTNISTAEDPCEFNLEGINQVNIRKDIGFDFAKALKSFLRQDPDIIMVGEIRDTEVGEMAVEAALTGHFVFSTLHTNDAASTVTRLLNLGVEPFLVVSSLSVITAQRLCKKICENCKEEVKSTSDELVACGLEALSAAKVKIYKGKGCDHCNQTGNKGRVAIHEILEVTPGIKSLVLNGASTDEIKQRAIYEGMRTLRMSALMKVAQGLISLEEAVLSSSADII